MNQRKHTTIYQKGAKYSKADQVKFVEESLCWDRPCYFKFFKGCLSQIFLDSFLDTLTQISDQFMSVKLEEDELVQTLIGTIHKIEVKFPVLIP